MSRLPVIVGFGGINPAGRSSSHHAYRRLVIDALETTKQERTYAALGALMNLGTPDSIADRQYLLDHTLIRKLESNLFNAESILLHKSAQLTPSPAGPVSFTVKRSQLPDNIRQGGKSRTWKIPGFWSR